MTNNIAASYPTTAASRDTERALRSTLPVSVHHGSDRYPRPSPGPVVTIGNFDGVHLGHRSLIDRTVELARSSGVPACVYTFDPCPRDVLRPDNDIHRIQSLNDKIAALQQHGIDSVVVERFTRGFGEQPAEWFAHEILERRLGASALVVGWDFRFGRGRTGTVADLASWTSIAVEQVTALTLDGQVVSSSRIRELVADGDVRAAAALLDRPHQLVGEVVTGHKRGRKLGFPTANLQTTTQLVPAFGVYAVRIVHQGKTHIGVANFGSRPTFVDSPPVLEVHILDYAGDLYGEELRVELIERLRGEEKFGSADELVEQIRADVAHAREIL